MSTGSIGQTQIRMVQPGTPRIGQTTIRPTTPQIIRTSAPAMRPLTTIRGQTTIVQTNNQMPALHPVSGATIISSGAQVRWLFFAVDVRLLLNILKCEKIDLMFCRACQYNRWTGKNFCFVFVIILSTFKDDASVATSLKSRQFFVTFIDIYFGTKHRQIIIAGMPFAVDFCLFTCFYRNCEQINVNTLLSQKDF